MGDFEYDALLDRARDRIPTDISERNRWTMPIPEILVEGNQTIIRNFSSIVDAMDRDANHVYQYLINELGTSGTREQVRVMLKGRVPPKRIKEKIVAYVKTYILCGQCKAPDTRFIKEDRTTLLKCQACGATRPVRL
ncbi:MAG: translation initiation factor IF-2 subunit beta [Candidatus Thalassarchaeaceae archaeon]